MARVAHRMIVACGMLSGWAAARTLACILLLAALPGFATEPWSVFGPPLPSTPELVLDKRPGDQPPAHYADTERWVAGHRVLRQVDMLGGSFWLLTHFRPDGSSREWSVALANTWYREAQLTILGDDGSRQVFNIDRDGTSHLLAGNSATVHLRAGHDYVILVAVTTPLFTSLPRIDIEAMASHQQRHTNELVLTLATLGLLTGLGVFVLFIGVWIRAASYVLYGVQCLLLVLGWGFYFNLPWQWLGIDTGPLNFSFWFILLSIANACFTIAFLELRQHGPALVRCGQAVVGLALVALPVSFIYPSLAHFLASVQVSLVVTFSIASGLWALARGVRQARFFTLAFLCVLISGLLILPANFGLLPDPIDNADLLTLLGSGCEAVLLALALADKVKLLTDARERFRTGMQEAVSRASIDPLTGIGNRRAFDDAIKELTNQMRLEPLRGTVQIAMIDLDGLKHVNDDEGHDRGDMLLRETGNGLARLATGDIRVFRLGGDEFAIIAIGDDLTRQRLARSLEALDRELRQSGFPQAGISFGLRSASALRRRLSSAELAQLVREADRAMYRHKEQRREARGGQRPLR